MQKFRHFGTARRMLRPALTQQQPRFFHQSVPQFQSQNSSNNRRVSLASRLARLEERMETKKQATQKRRKIAQEKLKSGDKQSEKSENFFVVLIKDLLLEVVMENAFRLIILIVRAVKHFL